MTARSSQQQLKTQHIHDGPQQPTAANTQHIHDGPQQPTAAEHPTYS